MVCDFGALRLCGLLVCERCIVRFAGLCVVGVRACALGMMFHHPWRNVRFSADLQREFEVLKLAAKGMTNKDIAQKLSISERTVQTHFSNIFRKLGVGSRTEAVLHALKEGWLSPEDLP